ncbi:FAD-binding protein [Anianabacter salinae]|uniref:FAD-binding protein n=1 Tax=Anianabacter salinae TaxID=2851023 RepID=UPI00225E6DCC|nr:FAD-binding protein [Anianabacter salinae]MBV0913072.1 FAD-binding protein [Anianabacter salinae]
MSPRDEAEMSEAVAGADGPLRILGGGTRPIGRPVAGAALSVAGLSGITLYEPGALTLVARAGTPLSEIEAALAAEGQRLAFEPMDHRGLLGTAGEPTIGGVVAANVSGPRRVTAGACRDHLLGVRFVDGTGAVVKNGGRVMKNVTGYDLVKLMAGSWGTLGVLTEVSLKVLPVPPISAALRIAGLPTAQALAAMTTALGSPYEVSGAAHLPGEAPVTLLRIEGFETQITHRTARLKDLLRAFGDIEVETDPAVVRELWAGIRDISTFHGVAGDVWRLSVKPSDAPGLLARADAEGAALDWGGGLVWLRLPEGTDLRARLGAFGGHATLVRASAATRAAIAPFQPEVAPVAALSEGIRRRFDPRGILNPGLMA